MHTDIKKILVTHDQIVERSKELAEEITLAYKDRKAPLLVALLKGSIPFLAEFMKHLNMDIEVDFMDVSSYEGTESIGDVRILKDLDQSVKGDNILLVEDIVDTGKTLKQVSKMLYNKGANSVEIVTLLDKPERRLVDVKADYIGFVIPNEFVVGFGLDYNEKYRNLPYVGVLKDELYL
jgi:hypoxanthine phosphoribosyltransferase